MDQNWAKNGLQLEPGQKNGSKSEKNHVQFQKYVFLPYNYTNVSLICFVNKTLSYWYSFSEPGSTLKYLKRFRSKGPKDRRNDAIGEELYTDYGKKYVSLCHYLNVFGSQQKSTFFSSEGKKSPHLFPFSSSQANTGRNHSWLLL